jgi:hypothetical protein
MMNAQVLPFNGTSGWAGSDASKNRQMFIDESGETSKRQQSVIDELRSAGTYGAIWRDIALALNIHHGQASAALSVLHRENVIARLADKRSKCSIYVLPEFVNGRATTDGMKTQASINANAVKAVRALHSETETSDITGKIYCKECQYEYPCDTIKLVGQNADN